MNAVNECRRMYVRRRHFLQRVQSEMDQTKRARQMAQFLVYVPATPPRWRWRPVTELTPLAAAPCTAVPAICA